MKLIFSLIIATVTTILFAAQEPLMTEYQTKMLERRSSEARELWNEMKSSGFTTTTVAALDFVYFSNSEREASNLIEQLSENYTLELVPADNPEYVLVNGTTRPYGNEFTYEQWIDWVEFMVKVGFSHNSTFSTWSVYSPKTKSTWSSESIEVE